MEEKKYLKQALDEIMSEELKKVPPEQELKETHVFTGAFKARMEKLIQDERTKEKRKKAHRMTRILEIAACFVCIVGIGTLIFTQGLFGPMGSSESKNSAIEEDATEESASTTSEGMDEKTEENEAATEDGISGFTQEDGEHESDMGYAEETFRLVSQSYDGEFHIEVMIQNNTDTDMTYSPIYQWDFTVDGQTTSTNVDMDIEAGTKVLASGDSVKEEYDLNNYGVGCEGTLVMTRDINGESTELTVSVEE